MKKTIILLLLVNIYTGNIFSQTIVYKKQHFELKNVTAAVIKLDGRKVLKVERDLAKLPFDVKHLEATVDEPTYIKLKDLSFENGTIEVKMLSRIQNPSPFEFAQGFIGVAFRIAEQDSAYESIYLRPKVGRSDNQQFRNHTVQYYSYPHYKFDTLRKLAPMMYEAAAPVNINEWISVRIEVNGQRAELFVNGAKYSTLVVDRMKGNNKSGAIALWVDIGTVGYFKDLVIAKK